MAFEKLVELLDDADEYKTARADFCAASGRADKLSKEVWDRMDNYVEICSSSRADYYLNCWDSTWQDALAELTAIRAALERKDNARTHLCQHFLAYLEILESIHETEHLTGLDWTLLTRLDPKGACRQKLLAKKRKIEKTYDKLFEAVNTLLEEPVEVPEIDENKLVDQASIESATHDGLQQH